MSPRSLKRYLRDYLRHPWLHLVSLFTVSGALFILGIFFVGYHNLDQLAEKTNPRVTGTAYLMDGLTSNQIDEVYESIVLSAGVEKATFKDKKSVLSELDSVLGQNSVSALAGGELFPDVIEIQMKEGFSQTQLNELKISLSSRNEVSEVDFSDGWLGQYHKLRHMLHIVGIVLLAGMVVASSLIIANFMGMRHQSRRDEMDIIRLMGAQRSFVLFPFICEGIVEGGIAAAMSLALLYGATMSLSHFATARLGGLLEGQHIVFLSTGQSALLMALGVCMALGGSLTVFFRFHYRAR